MRRPFALFALAIALWCSFSAQSAAAEVAGQPAPARATGAVDAAPPADIAPARAAQSGLVKRSADFLGRGTLRDYQLASLRFATNAAALLIVGLTACFGRRLTRRGRSVLAGLLGVLAASQVAANYNYFAWSSPHGFHASEMFHYSVGAEYFPELGYFDLYLCSAAAAVGDGARGSVVLRDLRGDRLRAFEVETLPRDRCGGRFEADRWQAFQRDVRWFRTHMGDALWARALRDHGYNPSPVWTAIGRPIASLAPTSEAALRLLAKLDLALLLAALAAVGWAFGFEIACLVALVWGGTGLNRYGWVGDAFLRELWFATSLVGLALLRKGWRGLAGAGLTAAALLRLFPAIFVAGAALSGAGERWRDGRWSPAARRAAQGAVVSTLILLVLGAAVSGRGVEAYSEFAANIAPFSQRTAGNSLGLRRLLAYSRVRPSAVEWQGERIADTDQRYPHARQQRTLAGRRPLQWAVVATFALLFVRAAWRRPDWQAAAAGFALIPVLSQPPCYYIAFLAPAALLAAPIAWLRVAVMAAVLAISGGHLAYFGRPGEYLSGSIVALLLGLTVLVALQFPERQSPASGDS